MGKRYSRRTITVYVKPTTYRRKGKLVHRKGYRYKRVDLGKPGKGSKLIKIKAKGALRKHGYGVHKSPSARHRALKKAIEEYGALSVFRKLMAQYVFRKNYDPETAKEFRADAEWVKEHYTRNGEFIS